MDGVLEELTEADHGRTRRLILGMELCLGPCWGFVRFMGRWM
jgi:hypothetical protein